jgi:Bifunctional DNA primase/polymerase, N-terminal
MEKPNHENGRESHLTCGLKPAPSLAWIQSLLGECVLLQCKGKVAIKKGWSELTIADMTPEYLAGLNGCNVGVLLGLPSNGLVTIDIDSDEGAEEFLRLNPKLLGTLRTRGRRGCNVWIRLIDGAVPNVIRLAREGMPWGELRGTGGQTIIHGDHPDTKQPYTIENKAAPMSFSIREVVWPPRVESLVLTRFLRVPSDRDVDDVDGTQRRRDAETSPASICISSASHLHLTPLTDAAKAILAAADGRDAAGGEHSIENRLFDRFIGRKFLPSRGSRNAFIVASIPFLFRALSLHRARSFSQRFYRENAATFEDSIQTHMSETDALLETVEQSYLAELSPEEKQVHDLLNADERNGLRIVRCLALSNGSADAPPPTFFLSMGELAARIDVAIATASRMLFRFRTYQILNLEEPGQRRVAGVKGKAGKYRYLLNPRPEAGGTAT